LTKVELLWRKGKARQRD